MGLAGNCQQLVKLNEKDKEDLRKETDKEDLRKEKDKDEGRKRSRHEKEPEEKSRKTRR